METYAFAIDTRPQRIWDWSLEEKNLKFLRGIDPEYFVHVAKINAALLKEGDNHHAALAIRLAYSHALETFMSFAGAAIQAPACPLGWLLRYSNEDLRSVIRKITRGGVQFSRVSGPPTWEGLANLLVADLTATPEEKQAISTNFSKLWLRLARDFLNNAQEVEYNNLKHGLRVAAGGFKLRIGRDLNDGVPPPTESMTVLGASAYGSSFYIVERPVGGKIDFRPRQFSRNWHPENLFFAIQLLALSLRNVVAFLRVRGGDTAAGIKLEWLEEDASYLTPWIHDIGVDISNWDFTITGADIAASTKEEVFEEIRCSGDGGADPPAA